MSARCENCLCSLRRKRDENSKKFRARRFCSVPCRRLYEDRHGKRKAR